MSYLTDQYMRKGSLSSVIRKMKMKTPHSQQKRYHRENISNAGEDAGEKARTYCRWKPKQCSPVKINLEVLGLKVEQPYARGLPILEMYPKDLSQHTACPCPSPTVPCLPPTVLTPVPCLPPTVPVPYPSPARPLPVPCLSPPAPDCPCPLPPLPVPCPSPARPLPVPCLSMSTAALSGVPFIIPIV